MFGDIERAPDRMRKVHTRLAEVGVIRVSACDSLLGKGEMMARKKD